MFVKQDGNWNDEICHVLVEKKDVRKEEMCLTIITIIMLSKKYRYIYNLLHNFIYTTYGRALHGNKVIIVPKYIHTKRRK